MFLNMNYFSILHEVRSFAFNKDIGVVFQRVEKGKEFVPFARLDTRTGKRTITLEKPDATWSEQRMIEWRGHFFHEMGHLHPKHVDDYQILVDNKIASGSFFAMGLNCLTDYRQEKTENGLYTGRDKMLSLGQKIGVERILKTHGDKFGKLDGKDDASIFTALLWLSTETRESWQRDVIGLGNALRSKISAPLEEKVALLQSGGFCERLDACDSAQELYDLWKDILDLFERDSDEEEQKAKGMAEESGEYAEGEGEGEGKSKDGSGDADGDEKGKGKGKGKPSKDKGDGDDDNPTDAVIDWKDLQVHEHDIEPKASRNSLTINYNGYEETSTFKVAEKLDIRDYVNDKGDLHSTPDSEYMNATEHGMEHNGIANKIRKLLQVKTQSLTVHGQKKGKLASKNMYRVGVKDIGRTRERVFKKKVHQYDLDTAVSVLVDFSGSMGGWGGESKMSHAIVSAMMLNEAIGKINVPVEVLGFTDHGNKSTISILKTFNKPISNQKLRENMCRAAQGMSNNADGEAILYAHSRLAVQPNARKLLLVLSDGQPATSRHGCMGFTQEVVKRIEASRSVEIYGLGIQSDAVKRIYKHNSVINSPDELEGAVLSVIKNHILR